ncbi:hypothetical protein H4S08_000821 [Coemansia sp. RSA 1365]|nr:hypothetical protein H4S08_000821 [Coemansia sp. RSA 1365]
MRWPIQPPYTRAGEEGPSAQLSPLPKQQQQQQQHHDDRPLSIRSLLNSNNLDENENENRSQPLTSGAPGGISYAVSGAGWQHSQSQVLQFAAPTTVEVPFNNDFDGRRRNSEETGSIAEASAEDVQQGQMRRFTAHGHSLSAVAEEEDELASAAKHLHPHMGTCTSQTSMLKIRQQSTADFPAHRGVYSSVHQHDHHSHYSVEDDPSWMRPLAVSEHHNKQAHYSVSVHAGQHQQVLATAVTDPAVSDDPAVAGDPVAAAGMASAAGDRLPVMLSNWSGHSAGPRTTFAIQQQQRRQQQQLHVARTNNDIGQAGELRYRPYPEIPSASNRGSRGVLGVAERSENSGAAERKVKRANDMQKRRRRTQACEYCHTKKVKCEGEGVRCINCIKNDVQCVWGQKRKRGPKPKSGTALAMRAQRQHGARGRQQQRYEQSVRVNMVATGDDRPDEVDDDGEGDEDDDAMSTAMPSSSPPTSKFEGIRMPQMEEELSEFFSDKVDADTRETVRYYFDYFYPLNPMFHPSMFIRRVVHGDVDPLLIDAMRAATARVISSKTGRVVDERAMAQSVKQRILLQLEQPTVDLLRTLIVVSQIAGTQGEYVTYNSLICLTASLVVRMGLHQLDLYKRPPPCMFDEWVALEVKRRLFWLVYQIDSYQAMLTGRPMSIAEDSVYVSAPCSDYEWDVMHVTRHRVPPPRSGDASGSGSAGAMRGASRQRSSRSSSDSGASLSNSLRVDRHEIVATGAFSYSFMALCELTAIIAKINTFLRDSRTSRPSLLVSTSSLAASAAHTRDVPFPAIDFMHPPFDADSTNGLVFPVLRTVRLTSEYPVFVELNERLEDWRRSLLMPEDLRDDSTEAAHISYFGTADHRRFMMRVRYFCLHCYYVPITIFLHQSNRPSFFTEYEQPLDVRLAKMFSSAKSKSTSPATPGNEPAAMGPAVGDSSEEASAIESERALREMLSRVFASTWNEGVLAYDIEPRSWKACVQAAKGLSDHIKRNSDFPLDRFDQVIPFCIFMSVSVLIRQVRICSRMLQPPAAQSSSAGGMAVKPEEEQGQQKDYEQDYEQRRRKELADAGGYSAVLAEQTRCIQCLKHQWKTLQSLGTLWDVAEMESLLKSMHVDEVANTAEMFSGMSL